MPLSKSRNVSRYVRLALKARDLQSKLDTVQRDRDAARLRLNGTQLAEAKRLLDMPAETLRLLAAPCKKAETAARPC